MDLSALVLSLLAAGMAASTAYLVAWAAQTRTAIRASVVLFLLLMMAAMLVGGAVYYLGPSPSHLVEGLWVASALMSASVLPLFVTVLREAAARTRDPDGSPSPVPHRGAFVTAVVGLVLANEILMGWVFSVAAGVAIHGGFFAELGEIVVSPWFVFTMAGEMGLSVFLLRKSLPTFWRTLLVAQAGIMLLSPPVLDAPLWASGTVLVSSGLMTAVLVYLMEFVYRHREIAAEFADYVVRLIAVFSLMMIGLFVWIVDGSVLLFAVSVLVEMVLFFPAILVADQPSTRDPLVWQLRPGWAFQLLAGIFVAELFMGALLDVEIFGASWLGLVPALPLTGAPATVLGNAASNGFWFVALVTGSTWFLAMMGVEMGTLVVFKMRETKHREQRARYSLMIAAYAIGAVFFPSTYYAIAFPKLPSGTSVPVLGWSMGIGSAPLAPSILLVVVATYAIVGALSILFGRRAICSVLCTAPLMYQGTTIDAMKSYNRTSPIARKYLGTRFSELYGVTTGLVMGSLALASVVSYLDATGRLDLTLFGADPTVFLFALYFGVLWYVAFFTIPYTGNYNCVTMGWCYTGTIAQAFQKVGFFKLKAKDKAVCKACTTLDCAKSCPVGLIDMVGQLRTKGEFRSSKCCGVGDCTVACPYGNLYISDIRHWLRDRVRPRPSPHPGAGLPVLPMIVTTARSGASRTGRPREATTPRGEP